MKQSNLWCIFIAFLFQVSYQRAQAQQLKQIEWADILNQWVTSEDTVLTYSNLHIIDSDKESRLSELPLDSAGRRIINKKIIFKNVKSLEFLSFDESYTRGIVFDRCAIDQVAIINSHFKSFEFSGRSISFQIEKNLIDSKSGITIAGYSGLSTTQVGSTDFRISNNKFADFYIDNSHGCYDIIINQNTFRNFSGVFNGKVEIGAAFTKNTFLNPENNGRVLLALDTEYFVFNDNILHSDFIMFRSSLTGQMDFESNTFNKSVSFTKVSFPEHFNNISWHQFNDHKLAIRLDNNYLGTKREIPEVLLYKAERQSDFEDEVSYNALISLYTRLHTIFRNNGNIISSNGCYAEMKEIEGKKFQSLYQNQPTFKNYFRWKLNQLMKFYTNHGTDPALAIVISMYVLIAFAVFYFFFPSEWDVTSKSILIQNFKDFIQRNDKGYAKPFMMMLFGFGISIVNAMTLSLNSFTTLGFGTIPTKGLARYVCIIQGFIGWFLLSIFTVALINQVLP